jgi:hypothetical protein
MTAAADFSQMETARCRLKAFLGRNRRFGNRRYGLACLRGNKIHAFRAIAAEKIYPLD